MDPASSYRLADSGSTEQAEIAWNRRFVVDGSSILLPGVFVVGGSSSDLHITARTILLFPIGFLLLYVSECILGLLIMSSIPFPAGWVNPSTNVVWFVYFLARSKERYDVTTFSA